MGLFIGLAIGIGVGMALGRCFCKWHHKDDATEMSGEQYGCCRTIGEQIDHQCPPGCHDSDIK